MKNLNMKKAISALLATTMVVGMAVPAFAASSAPTLGGKTVDGDSTITTPIIEFVIPLKTDFAIDAFNQSEATGPTATSQIFSAEFGVINKSNIPIRVDIKSKLSLATGVAVVETPLETLPKSSTDTEKRVFMQVAVPAVVAATEVPGTAGSGGAGTAGTITLDASTYAGYDPDTTGAKDKAVAILGTSNASLVFALKAADYIAPNASDTDKTLFEAVGKDSTVISGASAFRYVGSVNSVAEWKAKDITVKGVFTVVGLTGPMYTADKLTAVAGSANVIEVKNAAKPTMANGTAGATQGTVAGKTMTLSSGTTSTFTLVPSETTDVITGTPKFEIVDAAGVKTLATAAQVSYAPATKLVTITAAGKTAIAGKSLAMTLTVNTIPVTIVYQVVAQ